MHPETKQFRLTFIRKMPSLLLGLFLFATGILATLYSNLGMSPWGVFHMGLTNYTPLTLGQASQLTGLIILVGTYWIGVIPGLASVFNMLFVGFFVDLIASWDIFFTPSTLLGRATMLSFGILLIGWASYFYLRVELGAGPRDGLMEGLIRRLDKPVWVIRGTIEVTVLTIGYLLGGPVGIGTLITACTIGLAVQLAFTIGKYDSKRANHIDLIKLYQGLRPNKNSPTQPLS